MAGTEAAGAHAASTRIWAEQHAAELVGSTGAEAERMVARAGLHVKVVRPPAATTLEFRTDRVTLLLDEQGTVTEARAG